MTVVVIGDPFVSVVTHRNVCPGRIFTCLGQCTDLTGSPMSCSSKSLISVSTFSIVSGLIGGAGWPLAAEPEPRCSEPPHPTAAIASKAMVARAATFTLMI